MACKFYYQLLSWEVWRLRFVAASTSAHLGKSLLTKVFNMNNFSRVICCKLVMVSGQKHKLLMLCCYTWMLLSWLLFSIISCVLSIISVWLLEASIMGWWHVLLFVPKKTNLVYNMTHSNITNLDRDMMGIREKRNKRYSLHPKIKQNIT